MVTNTKGAHASEMKPSTCQRCHGLQNCDTLKSNNLHLGCSDSPLLSQENFVKSLKPITNANDEKKKKIMQ